VCTQALTFDPNDADAVEGAAVSYAQLGKFVKADEKLQKLVALRPTDVEAVRLLVSASLPNPNPNPNPARAVRQGGREAAEAGGTAAHGCGGRAPAGECVAMPVAIETRRCSARWELLELARARNRRST
jgi:hypothetical protein